MKLEDYTNEIREIRNKTNKRIADAAVFAHNFNVSNLLEMILMNEQAEIAELRMRSNYNYR
jgi:hypothetical protein